MQTTDLATLLQVMQSPGGMGLLPTVVNRENMVMDQSRARLQDTIARTQLAQQEGQRAQEMHPLTMDHTRAQTSDTRSRTTATEFDNNIRQRLGQEHFIGVARGQAQDAEIERAKKLTTTIDSVLRQSAAIQGVAPGAKRAMIIRGLDKVADPAFLQAIEAIPENELEGALRGTVDTLNRSLPGFTTAQLQTESNDRNADLRLTSEREARAQKERLEELRRQLDLKIANIRASGDKNSETKLSLAEQILKEAFKAADNGQPGVAQALHERARIVANIKAQDPSVTVTNTRNLPDGSVEATTRRVPANQAQQPGEAPLVPGDFSNAYRGWGEPTRVSPTRDR